MCERAIDRDVVGVEADVVLVVVSAAVRDEHRRDLQVQLVDVAHLLRYALDYSTTISSQLHHQVEHVVEYAEMPLKRMLGVELESSFARIQAEHLHCDSSMQELEI